MKQTEKARKPDQPAKAPKPSPVTAPPFKVRMMLDSGAFTMWMQGKPVNLDDYIAFVQQYRQHLDTYVVLDAIPGSPGVPRTQAMVEESAKQTWANMARMKKAGLQPIPVYHLGERMYWLEKAVNEYPYIGIGGASSFPSVVRREFFDRVFAFLCGSRGYPQVKVHGFAVTAVPMMLEYPWTSVDSITWIKVGGVGDVLVPRLNDAGAWDYNVSPYVVGLSTNGQSTSTRMLGSATHYENCGPAVRQVLDRYLREQGISRKDAATNYLLRFQLNVRFFKDFEKQHRQGPFFKRQAGLFSKAVHSPYGADQPLEPFRVILTHDSNSGSACVLRVEQVRDQLISFERIGHPDARMKLDYYVRHCEVPNAKDIGKWRHYAAQLKARQR